MRVVAKMDGTLKNSSEQSSNQQNITGTNMQEDNWREEYKAYTSSRYELDLLENGPRSLAQSWMMGALYNKWKKIKGIKDPEPPDCSSSLQEWEKSIKKYQ